MFKIFIFDKFDKEKENSSSLIKKCAAIWGVDGNMTVEYDDRGKPSFKDVDVSFSISHSRNIWAAVMGEDACGLDIQEIKECQYEKLAERFFTKTEAEYVKKSGLNEYFSLWTRREALGKLCGEGFFMKKRPELVDESGAVCQSVLFGGRRVLFYEVELAEDFKAVWCTFAADNMGQTEIIRI